MKKNLLLLVAFFSINAAFAQFYVSPSIGYGIGSAGILTGTSLEGTPGNYEAKNHYGSFGEGMNVQLRGGYFFSEMFGVELGFAYLNGADQNTSSYMTNDDGDISEMNNSTAHARAYGLTAALIYNFNDNFYGKIGMVTKVGGKTEAEFTRSTFTPLSAFGVAPIIAEGETNFNGRIPLGFTAAFGYKHKIGKNLNFFAELEYLGINVTRDTSQFQKLTITTPATPALPAGAIGPSAVPAIPSMTWNLGDAPMNHPIFGTIWAPSDEITYEDSLPEPNTDPKKGLSSVAPYSSFGLNIGITYTFSKKEK